MPHIIVKLFPGKSEAQKQRLTQAITQAVTQNLDYGDAAVSVAFEEIAASDWLEKVFKPDIEAQPHPLYKMPGYSAEDLKGGV